MAGIDKLATKDKIYEKHPNNGNIILMHRKVTEEIHKDKLNKRIAELQVKTTMLNPSSLEENISLENDKQELENLLKIKSDIAGV